MISNRFFKNVSTFSKILRHPTDIAQHKKSNSQECKNTLSLFDKIQETYIELRQPK